MWYRSLQQTRMWESAGSPAGGASGGDAAGSSGTATPPAPAGGTGAPGATQPDAFSWDALKLEPDAHALVMERQWKTPSDVIKSYRNLEKLTGVPAEQMLKLPKGDDPAAWNEVYNRLGRPEKADGYKLPVPEGDSGEFAKVAAQWFHDAGLTQAGATKLATKWNEYMTGQQASQREAAALRDTQDVAALKQEWGADYDRHAAVVDKAAEAFGMTSEQLGALKQAMGPKAAMQFMRNIGSKLGAEDKSFHDGQASNGFNAMSPEQANAEILRLRGDKAFAQEFNSADPRVRSEARQKMARLSVIAAPGSREFSGRG